MSALPYTADAVADADAYIDAMGERHDRALACQAMAHLEILRTFMRHVKQVSAHKLTVPYSRDGLREEQMSLAEAISETTAGGESRAALMLVAEKSQCPYVAAWLHKMAMEYSEAYAENVGIARGDQE